MDRSRKMETTCPVVKMGKGEMKGDEIQRSPGNEAVGLRGLMEREGQSICFQAAFFQV